MARIEFHGAARHIVRSFAQLLRVTMSVHARRLVGRPLVPQWSAEAEIGNLFWRGQFDHAFALPDVAEGRAYFDSLQTFTDEVFQVDMQPGGVGAPRGDWFRPSGPAGPATILYFHGGGYAFYAGVTRRMIAMLAASLQTPIFAPDYRLTPEHPHPAQIEDALTACRFLLDRGVAPSSLVIAGDSAGGHLALMTLIALRDAGLPQPALALGLCPWTDIGARGASLTANDRYDLVQGWMAVRFGEWLRGTGGATREQLSPIHQDFAGLAPLYLQGGGKEVLIDMIRDFARVAEAQGADVMLDVWEHMTHDFQANGATLPESAEALVRLRDVIRTHTEPGAPDFAACARTEVGSNLPAGCVR